MILPFLELQEKLKFVENLLLLVRKLHQNNMNVSFSCKFVGISLTATQKKVCCERFEWKNVESLFEQTIKQDLAGENLDKFLDWMTTEKKERSNIEKTGCFQFMGIIAPDQGLYNLKNWRCYCANTFNCFRFKWF